MALPVTFVAGDVLEAAQLNSNFTYLEGAGGFVLISPTISPENILGITGKNNSDRNNFKATPIAP